MRTSTAAERSAWRPASAASTIPESFGRRQAVPIGIVASKPRHLETQHDADARKGHPGGEPLEAGADDGAGARPPEVLVDDERAY